MASRKLFFVKPKYIYPEIESEISQTEDENVFEFDESDIHNLVNHQLHNKLSISISRLRRKPAKTGDSDDRKTAKTGSLPVNIPDWSNILKSEYKSHVVPEDDDSDDEDEEDDDDGDSVAAARGTGGRRIIPPHEYLARRRGSSFTVHEGDLTILRNAIWEKIRFEN